MAPMLMKTPGLLIVMLPVIALAQQVQSNDYLTIDVGEVPTLNLAACDTVTSIDIELQNPRNADLLSFTEATLYVWWDEDDDCDIIPSTGTDPFIGEVELFTEGDTQSDSPLVSTIGFTFPEDMVEEGEAMPFTTATLFAYHSMCPPNAPVAKKELTLCFGLDLYEPIREITPTATLTTGIEPWGGVTFTMDTKAPETPHSVSANASDGVFRLQVTANDVDNDIASWQARVREQPSEALTDPDYVPTSCDLWENPRTVTRDESGSSATLAVTAQNGLTYEACARTRDRLDNVSGWSTVVSVTPLEECDFAECYPQGRLEGGCAAGGAPVWGWMIALLTLRNIKRNRAKRERRR